MSEFAPPVKQPKYYGMGIGMRSFCSLIPALIFPIIFGHVFYSDVAHKINGNKDCIYVEGYTETVSAKDKSLNLVVKDVPLGLTKGSAKMTEFFKQKGITDPNFGEDVTVDFNQLIKFGFLVYLLLLIVVVPMIWLR